MNRNVQSLLMIAAGGVLVWTATDGSYLRYVRSELMPWIVAAAVALMLIGLILLWAENEAKLAARVLREPEPDTGPWKRARHATPPKPKQAAEHDHGRLGSVVPLLVVLPLLALFLIQPRELGAYTAERSKSAQVEQPVNDDGQFAPLVGNDPVDVSLLELNQRALYGGSKTLTGRTLQVTGFVTQQKGAKTGDFYVNRLLIACCAADAIPIRAKVTGAPSAYTTETWVRITGTYAGNEEPGDPNLDPLPIIRVDEVKRIPVPKEPYVT